jgi:hypothetical protein
MRPLFTDGINSLLVFILGIVSYKFPSIIPVFLGYQFVWKPDSNKLVDTAEFVIGFMLYMALDTA